MTDKKYNAAVLLSQGKMPAVQIIKTVGISARTFYLWKQQPEFQAQVRTLGNEWREIARNQGMADQDARLRDLNDRHRRLRAVIQQRARDPKMQGVPGGNTGALCVTYKMRATGEAGKSEKITEYQVDTALFAEMRHIEEHIAMELGQWKQLAPAEPANAGNNLSITIAYLNAGRDRVALAQRALEAAEAINATATRL